MVKNTIAAIIMLIIFFIYTVIYQLKVQIYTCHHRSSWHRVSGIDFVTLCQQVFSACPDVEPWGGTELSAQIP